MGSSSRHQRERHLTVKNGHTKDDRTALHAVRSARLSRRAFTFRASRVFWCGSVSHDRCGLWPVVPALLPVGASLSAHRCRCLGFAGNPFRVHSRASDCCLRSLLPKYCCLGSWSRPFFPGFPRRLWDQDLRRSAGFRRYATSASGANQQHQAPLARSQCAQRQPASTGSVGALPVRPTRAPPFWTPLARSQCAQRESPNPTSTSALPVRLERGS